MVLKPTTPWTTPTAHARGPGAHECPHCDATVDNPLSLHVHMHHFHNGSTLGQYTSSLNRGLDGHKHH